jgi:hypothetical protein
VRDATEGPSLEAFCREHDLPPSSSLVGRSIYTEKDAQRGAVAIEDFEEWALGRFGRPGLEPRSGEQLRLIDETEARYSLWFRKPWQDGGTARLPQGTILVVCFDAGPAEYDVRTVPDRYDELENLIVPVHSRQRAYNGYEVRIAKSALAEVAEVFAPATEDFDLASAAAPWLRDIDRLHLRAEPSTPWWRRRRQSN